MRTLIFGPMPKNAGPDTHIAAGAWCFTGQEERFPGWDGVMAACAQDLPFSKVNRSDKRVFPLPPDPFPNALAVNAAAKAANGEVLRLIDVFGKRFNTLHKKNLSARFWSMALGPVLLLAVHMLAERQKRVLDLVELHGNRPLRVALLPGDVPFSFANSLEFMLHGVQNVFFNHYVYSRIVEAVAPPSWQLTYQPGTSPHQAGLTARQPRPLTERLKETLRACLLRLPFPHTKGFRLWQTLALSLAVGGNTRRSADRSLDFSLYCDDPLTWHFPAEQLIFACIPKDIPKNIRRTAFPALKAPGGTDRPGPLRGMSPAYSQDDGYRLHLAGLLERGCRLFSIQHGANYGNLHSIGGLPFEYRQHAFFTWGWERHESAPSNARPLPHPIPASVADTHRERAPHLILAGTEMSSFSYRLKSRTQSKAMLAYRAAKLTYLRSVDETLGQQAQVLYRPYFKTAGGLDDEAYILRHLPHTAICKGDLTTRLLGCRLLVLDHYGTTLHVALAANVPTIAFWKSSDWGFDSESAWMVDILRETGILFETPQEAAARTVAIWPDVQGWWRDTVVQSVRKLWLDRYARIGNTPEHAWNTFTLTLRWFNALRNC
jgi:putative transferase (TIGR04331 family)